MTQGQIDEIKAEVKELRTRVERLTLAVVALALISGGASALRAVIGL